MFVPVVQPWRLVSVSKLKNLSNDRGRAAAPWPTMASIDTMIDALHGCCSAAMARYVSCGEA